MEAATSASAFGSRSNSQDRLSGSPALSSASAASAPPGGAGAVAGGGGRLSLAAAEALDLLLDGCLPPSSALQPRLSQSQSSYSAASQDSLGRSPPTPWPLRLFLSAEGAVSSSTAALSTTAPLVVSFSELARLPELAHFSGYSSVSTL